MDLEKEQIELESITSVHAMLDYLWGLIEEVRLQILTMWWHWWNNQNKIKEGEMLVHNSEMAWRTLCNSMEYLKLFKTEEKRKAKLKWQPHGDGMLKANLNGAYKPGNPLLHGALSSQMSEERCSWLMRDEKSMLPTPLVLKP
ncbi:Threonine dehydratase [Hordeum vulgare]|nr:Threonine dehydratase [Hordeum vulgare]